MLNETRTYRIHIGMKISVWERNMEWGCGSRNESLVELILKYKSNDYLTLVQHDANMTSSVTYSANLWFTFALNFVYTPIFYFFFAFANNCSIGKWQYVAAFFIEAKKNKKWYFKYYNFSFTFRRQIV